MTSQYAISVVFIRWQTCKTMQVDVVLCFRRENKADSGLQKFTNKKRLVIVEVLQKTSQRSNTDAIKKRCIVKTIIYWLI